MTRPQVQIFVLNLDEKDAGGQADVMLLDATERARAERFHFARDRTRFVAAHAGLRRTLGAKLDAPPAALSLVTRPNVKPRFAASTGWHFNLSHSGGVALVAVTDAGPVGVDVEVLRDLPDMAAVAQEVFTPDERSALFALPQHDRAAGFFRAWTRKEAVIKATGEGFAADLKAFGVTLGPDAPAGFARPPAVAGGCHFALEHVDPGCGAVAAVAVMLAQPIGLDVQVVR